MNSTFSGDKLTLLIANDFVQRLMARLWSTSLRARDSELSPMVLSLILIVGPSIRMLGNFIIANASANAWFLVPMLIIG